MSKIRLKFLSAKEKLLLARSPNSESYILWTLAWPAVVLNLLQILNHLLDIKSVGHMPTAALTAVGSASMITMLMYAVCNATSVAASALVSRAYGARDEGDCVTATRQVFVLGMIFSIICAIIIYLLIPFIVGLLIPAKDTLAAEYMHTYLVLTNFSLPATMIIQVLAGALIAIGDSRSQMFISGFQLLFHLILNIIFIPSDVNIFGINVQCFGLGITGAGISFAASLWVAAFVYIYWAAHTRLGNVLILTVPDISWAKRIASICLPASITWFLKIGMYIVFTRALVELANGSVAIAAIRAGFALENICIMPAVGLSQAAGALVGQSLGMKDADRAARFGWLAGRYGAFIVGIVSVILFIYVPDIACWLVNGKMDVVEESVSFIRILCFMQVFHAYATILSACLQNAGDTKSPLWMVFISLWLVRIPGVYWVTQEMEMGSTGAWVVMSLTLGLYGIMNIGVFASGKWKTVKV